MVNEILPLSTANNWRRNASLNEIETASAKGIPSHAPKDAVRTASEPDWR
jgi:hypothetical protein